MSNELLFDFAPILNASKNKDYRISVTRKCTALMHFFHDRQLMKVNPFTSEGQIKDDLKLYEKDFKENVGELFGKPVSNWFKYLDRGGDVNNTTILEKGLASINLEET
jgi:hypothetical protein